MQDKKEVSMSHVDEGMLHTYIDGELPAAERVTLEAHLAQCEACRARLAEERALLNRANALLGAARPVERPMPSFDQVRRPPKRSPWRVRMPVAWAASIALALGLGYVLHDASYREAAPLPLAEADKASTVSRDSVVAAPEVATRQEEPKPPARSQGERQRKPANDEPAAALGLQSTDNRALYATGRMDSNAMKVTGRAAALPNAGPPGTVAAAAPAPVADSITALAGRVPTASLQRQEAALTVRQAAKAWPRIDRQTAKTILGDDPVGLPDLSTVSFRRSPDREGVVVVEQELDPRTTIQIFQQSARARSSVIDSMVSGTYLYHGNERERTDRLARFVGNLRVEIGGPISVDSLNRLLDLVRPLP